MTQNNITLSNRYLGCLLGLACGDAVGAPLEFKERGTFTPIKDIAKGGKFGMQPGEWTDDTAMALCLAKSLIECKEFDAHDQMTKYLRWVDDGYCSTRDNAFGIGQTVLWALVNFHRNNEPFSGNEKPNSAGNGGLMRLAPVPMFFNGNQGRAVHFSIESTRTTHAAEECLASSEIFTHYLLRAFSGLDKQEILGSLSCETNLSEKLVSIVEGDYRYKTADNIKGSGYVVESLEAALWCFYTTNSFKDAILKAANLGDDADTTAAICGQLAGAYYGFNAIPERWIEFLFKSEEIKEIALKLYELNKTHQ